GPEYISFSPDGTTVASSGYEQVRFWEVSSGRQIKQLSGDITNEERWEFETNGPIALSPRGKLLILVQAEGLVALYEPESLKRLQKLDANKPAALSADGWVAATINRIEDTSTLWDTKTGKKLCEIPGKLVKALSADGKLFAADEPQVMDEYTGRMFVGESAT